MKKKTSISKRTEKAGMTVNSNTKELSVNQKMSVVTSMIQNVSTMRNQALQRLLNPINAKDVNKECGYPDNIDIADYKKTFSRNGIAKRAVQILPEESWAMFPEVYENENEGNETEFEKTWTALEKEKKIFHYLRRIDVLSGIGQFGVLLLGLNDGKQLSEAVEGINELTGEKTGNQNYELLYLKPFDQGNVKILTKEANVNSPRFGYPKTYSIQFESADAQNSFTTLNVHWTRIIHVADNRECSEVLGIPRLESVYDRILDIIKVLGGSGEMFWKGGFPGLAFESSTDPLAPAMDTDAVKDEVESYMASLQRYIAVENMQVKSLNPQVASPKEHIEANLRDIAISLGIPYRIFLGTEEAKLASSQDITTWNKRITSRQENYISPYIIRSFIDRLIAFGILPKVEEYFIDWPDLNTPTDADKAIVAKTITEALSSYVAGGVDSLIPPLQYFTMFLGLSMEEAEAIQEAAKEHVQETEEKAAEENDTLLKQATAIVKATGKPLVEPVNPMMKKPAGKKV